MQAADDARDVGVDEGESDWDASFPYVARAAPQPIWLDSGVVQLPYPHRPAPQDVP